MIRLQHVSKVFRQGPARVPALNDVSFTVGRGEFVVLSGRSGAGKTTLLRLLYRDELPTEGEIEVADFDVTELRRSEVPHLRRALGVVFQDAKLLDGRTVFENVAFVLRVLGTPRREIRSRTLASLKAVGLSARAQAYPHQLSQGEAQRAAFARALVKAPALLLADEPTGNLDDDMELEILELLKDIWSRGTTVLVATHQARVATQLKRRTLTLAGGQLLKDEG
jgi:cell division transport system ATP-binding protein